LEYFYLLNSILFFRLFFLFRDRPISLKSSVYLTVLQVFPLFIFHINLLLISFTLLLLSVNLLLYHFEKSGKLNFYRFISFLFLFTLAGLFSSEYFSLEFNSSLIKSIKSISAVPSFLNKLELDYYKIIVIIFGVLVLLNEINFLIRYFFEVLNLYPVYSDENKPVDEKEYNAGRVIGMLERILIYLFVLVNEITVIGFIIAAKGFTRFKELDKRDFAEYVLIGTLLSAFFALIISFFVRKILLL
jgi:hypothetical protein